MARSTDFQGHPLPLRRVSHFQHSISRLYLTITHSNHFNTVETSAWSLNSSAQSLDVFARLPWLSASSPRVFIPPRHMHDVSLPPESSSSIVINAISILLTHWSFSALVVTIEFVGKPALMHWQCRLLCGHCGMTGDPCQTSPYLAGKSRFIDVATVVLEQLHYAPITCTHIYEETRRHR